MKSSVVFAAVLLGSAWTGNPEDDAHEADMKMAEEMRKQLELRRERDLKEAADLATALEFAEKQRVISRLGISQENGENEK